MVLGNIQRYPRSGFGTGEHLNVPSVRFLVPGNIRQNHLIGNHPFVSRQIPWPFFSRELCRKAHIVGADLKEDSEDLNRKRTENRRE